MGKFAHIVNSYVAVVAFAVGFSVSGYIVKNSFPSIPLFIVLLSSGVVIFSSMKPVAVLLALAAGGTAIGWSVGQGLWSDL